MLFRHIRNSHGWEYWSWDLIQWGDGGTCTPIYSLKSIRTLQVRIYMDLSPINCAGADFLGHQKESPPSIPPMWLSDMYKQPVIKYLCKRILRAKPEDKANDCILILILYSDSVQIYLQSHFSFYSVILKDCLRSQTKKMLPMIPLSSFNEQFWLIGARGVTSWLLICHLS